MRNTGDVDTGDTGPVAVDSVERRVGMSDLVGYPLALGGAVFGWTLPSGRSTDLLDRFVELGGSFIDTADSYASGMSEQIIGKWMRERGMQVQSPAS